MNELIEKVIRWSHDRNIIYGSDSKTQCLKAMSELGELADGINKGRIDEIQDGIGDVIVCLINIAEQNSLSLEVCLQAAYNEIKDRKGTMINGVFVKDGDTGVSLGSLGND
jgi:NTP pyrophosphatase (non-canonical NTP hydrolase)